MGKIAECVEPGQQSWALGMFEQALTLIHNGPVVFGESHTSPVARAIIWDLIDTGLVKTFFTEQANPKDPYSQGAARRTLQEMLQPLAVGSKYGIELGTEDEKWKAINEIYRREEFMNREKGRGQVAIPYKDLMQHAVRHGILVYCYDLDLRTKKYSDEQKIKERNEQMASTYLNTATKSFPGTLLLGGSWHFDAHSNPTLLELMGLDKAKYFEC
jgi:hypothetical protein